MKYTYNTLIISLLLVAPFHLRAQLGSTHFLSLQHIENGQLPSATDTTHFIVYYGYVQYNEEKPDVETENVRHDYSNNDAPMIIAMNYKFEQLPRYLPYKTGWVHVRKINEEVHKYRYKAKYFNISFKPQALAYSYTLDAFYNNGEYNFMLR